MPPDKPSKPIEAALFYPPAFPDEYLYFNRDKKPYSCRQCATRLLQLEGQQLPCDRTPKCCWYCALRQIACSFTREAAECLSCSAEFPCDFKRPCGRCDRLGQVCLYTESESREMVMRGECLGYEKPFGLSISQEESSHQVPASAGGTSGREVVERNEESDSPPEIITEPSARKQSAVEKNSTQSKSLDDLAKPYHSRSRNVLYSCTAL